MDSLVIWKWILRYYVERNWEILGIKGPAVSEVIKRIEGRLDEEIKLRKEIESRKEK
jgi:hypothetical protein